MCPETNLFWKHLQNWISQILNVQIVLSVVDILFGVPCEPDNVLLHCINYVILQGKNFLYHIRLENKYIFFSGVCKDTKTRTNGGMLRG